MSETRSDARNEVDRGAVENESRSRALGISDADPEPAVEGGWRPSTKLTFIGVSCVVLWTAIIYGLRQLLR